MTAPRHPTANPDLDLLYQRDQADQDHADMIELGGRASEDRPVLRHPAPAAALEGDVRRRVGSAGASTGPAPNSSTRLARPEPPPGVGHTAVEMAPAPPSPMPGAGANPYERCGAFCARLQDAETHLRAAVQILREAGLDAPTLAMDAVAHARAMAVREEAAAVAHLIYEAERETRIR